MNHARMLELRAARLAAGERPLGWKVGFGSPAAMERLGIRAPLVGFLTDRSVIAEGAPVSLEGWVAPLLEPELAAYVDERGRIEGVGLALELADLDTPPADPEQILARNVYHRGVVLGRGRAPSAEGLTASVERNGEQVASTDDVQALTGELPRLARHVAATVGSELRAGDVVICGSIVAPLAVSPGDEIRYELAPLGSLTISFADSASSVSS